MRNEISFEFDNLPILTDLGFDAAPVDGIATVKFNEDGEWHVTDVSLNGSKRVNNNFCFIRKQVPLCRQTHPWLYAAIRDRLESGAFHETITDKVVEALDEMGIVARVA